MTNRSYRLLIGSLLLIFLYFDIHNGVYLLILLMFLEGGQQLSAAGSD